MVLAASVLAVAREFGVVMAGLSLGASDDVAPVQARLSPTPVFDSGEHGDPVVSELGELSRGLILDDDRVVLLDGRNLLFINLGTGELSTAGGHGGGPGEFEGSGLELAMFRAEDGLTVWDLNNDFRLTFLSATGELLGTRRVNLSPADFDHPVSIARLYGVFDDGSLAFVDGLPHMDGAEDAARLPDYLVEVGEGGQRRMIVEFRGGQTSTILFRHTTLLSVAGDKVAVADTESDEIRVVDRNGTIISRYSMPGERVKVSERHLATSLDEARAHDRRGHENMVRRLEAMGRSTEGMTLRVPDYRHKRSRSSNRPHTIRCRRTLVGPALRHAGRRSRALDGCGRSGRGVPRRNAAERAAAGRPWGSGPSPGPQRTGGRQGSDSNAGAD